MHCRLGLFHPRAVSFGLCQRDQFADVTRVERCELVAVALQKQMAILQADHHDVVARIVNLSRDDVRLSSEHSTSHRRAECEARSFRASPCT
jgi:hypothetical protein